MKFKETPISGAFEIGLEPIVDERGFFARSWCAKEFQTNGLNSQLAQCSVSFNPKTGTLRGMHFQAEPMAEAKTVRCVRGSVYDVILDLRLGSPTFKLWTAVILSDTSRNAVYIPEGCAHGFMTLQDETEVLYQISQFYDPALSRGVRWNDPAFGITWPMAPKLISQRDQSYPNFE